MNQPTNLPTGVVAEAEAKRPRMRRIHFQDQEPRQTYPMALIQHGWEVLEALDRHDYLTSSMVARMFFWGEPNRHGQARSLQTAQNATNEMCLRRLKDHGFVQVVPVASYPEWDKLQRVEFNLLTREGAQALKDYKGPGYTPNWNDRLRTAASRTYDHTLLSNNALASLLGTFRLAGGQVMAVICNRQLTNQIRNGQTYLKDIEPDAVIVVRFGATVRCYLLELDTGTESVRGSYRSDFDEKIPRYTRYFKERFVHDPFFHGMQQPQVLVITTKPRRVDHLREAIFAQRGRRTYWVSCLEWITPPGTDARDAVWAVPTMDGPQRLSFTESI